MILWQYCLLQEEIMCKRIWNCICNQLENTITIVLAYLREILPRQLVGEICENILQVDLETFLKHAIK